MANNISNHYGKLVKKGGANVTDVPGDRAKVGNRWRKYKADGTDAPGQPTGGWTAAPVAPAISNMTIAQKDEQHKIAIFNAQKSWDKHVEQQERIANAPIHTPKEQAYLRGEVDYGEGGMWGSGMGLTGSSREKQMNRYGPNHRGAASKERDWLDREQGVGLYRGSEPLRTTGHDGTVTDYSRTTKNRDGSETVTVTKRGKSMQYTVGRNGQIVDGSVRNLRPSELDDVARGGQEEYYRSNPDDPRWNARNDPDLVSRYTSPEGVDEAVGRSLPKRS